MSEVPLQGFVPQPGDPVVYFHQGHFDQLMEFPDTRAEQVRTGLPIQ